ncbi:MAG: hypothetical protein JRJ06_06475 [Deltaproteobacteria bacterium]|nr:hypothetical protein [Deltaproteobacteria bacterium]
MNAQMGDLSPPYPSSEIETVADNFGGFFYFYEDRQGNRCVTNSTENISGGFLVADASGAVIPSNISHVKAEGKPTEVFGCLGRSYSI